jgi:hypothetical protein
MAHLALTKASKLCVTDCASPAGTTACVAATAPHAASSAHVRCRSALRGAWVVKALVVTALLAALLVWVPNSAFTHWASAARVLSLPWLLFQGLIVLDGGYAMHEVLNAKVRAWTHIHVYIAWKHARV